jgi:hypothetical protein
VDCEFADFETFWRQYAAPAILLVGVEPAQMKGVVRETWRHAQAMAGSKLLEVAGPHLSGEALEAVHRAAGKK